MSNIDVVNDTNLTNSVNDYEHLKLIMCQEVILRERRKYVRKNSTDNAAGKSKTWTRAISMMQVCLQYISPFSNFENQVKHIYVLNLSTIRTPSNQYIE